MVDKIQYISKRIEQLVQVLESEKEILNTLLKELGYLFNSDILLFNETGKILSSFFNEVNYDNNKKNVNTDLNSKCNNFFDIKINEKIENIFDEDNYYNSVIIPINIFSKRKATLLLFKDDNFSYEELPILELIRAIITIILKESNNREEAEEIRKKNIVKNAIDALSYTELESLLYIFDELGDSEGVLIASKIADKFNITRSVIVNGLRKLESAELIETRSLGMKGTFIKILNDKLVNELHKMRI